MRTLKFIVDGQIIKPDPSCDFSNLVPGSNEYLRMEFAFSPDWTGCVKVATFWSMMGFEYQPQLLNDGKSCMVPSEALAKRSFKVQVIGQSVKTSEKITTNKIEVVQNGGKV